MIYIFNYLTLYLNLCLINSFQILYYKYHFNILINHHQIFIIFIISPCIYHIYIFNIIIQSQKISFKNYNPISFKKYSQKIQTHVFISKKNIILKI